MFAYLTKCCVIIPDCDQHTESEVRAELKRLREENPYNEKLNYRGDTSYVNEWATHAICYKLGIKIKQTKSVDMEFVQDTKSKISYGFFGTIARILLSIMQ